MRLFTCSEFSLAAFQIVNFIEICKLLKLKDIVQNPVWGLNQTFEFFNGGSVCSDFLMESYGVIWDLKITAP
jgi:hypothetical protein